MLLALELLDAVHGFSPFSDEDGTISAIVKVT